MMKKTEGSKRGEVLDGQYASGIASFKLHFGAAVLAKCFFGETYDGNSLQWGDSQG